MRSRPDRGRAGALAALAAGAVLPLAFAPFGLFPLAFLVPAWLFWLLDGVTVRRGAWRGFLFGCGMFGAGVSWVYVAIHDFGFTGAPLAALMTALLVLALALYPALLGALAAWGRQRCPADGRWFLLFLPALWVVLEWFRGWFLTGFPWLNLGYSQIDAPYGALAPLLGVYGISLAVAVTAGALLLLLRGGNPQRAAAALLAALLWGGALAVDGREWAEPAGHPLEVRLIQGNAPQITTWDPEWVQRRLDLYAQLTLEHLPGSQLVVWPENSVTVFFHELGDYFDFLAEEVREAGSALVVGVPVEEPDGSAYYTTMKQIGPPWTEYRKRHLVPFGEFVPLEGVLRGLVRFFDLPMSGFHPGPDRQGLMQLAGQPVAASVCYEDAFGEELLAALPEATLLINGSNNAWYGDSLAPHQHLQISRMRSRETARPLLRATTTGISALIDHHGRVTARSPQFETYVLSGRVQPMEGSTPYVRFGNRPLLITLALAGVLFLLSCRRRHSLFDR